MATGLLVRPTFSASGGLLAGMQPRLGPVTRRQLLGGAAGGALLLGLSACGGDQPDDESAGTGSSPTSPSRIVALGLGADADALIALGIIPVAMSAGYTGDVYSWTAQALGDRKVEVIKDLDGVPIEQIAAYRPDLIVATTLFGFDEVRVQLEGIATVVGPTTTADKESWRQTTMRVGEAVGRADEARRLVKDTEAALAAVRDAHPSWAGKTYTAGPAGPPNEPLYTINSTENFSAEIYASLGLVLSPKVTALPESDTAGRAIVSQEQINLLDADVVMLTHLGGPEAQAAFEAQPLFQQLAAVQRGSYIAQDGDVGIGLGFPSVLSIPYAVERLTPQLEKALDAG